MNGETRQLFPPDPRKKAQLIQRSAFQTVANSGEFHACLSDHNGVEIKIESTYGFPTDYRQGDHDGRA